MDEEKNCHCQPHWFWKWTYRLLFILLVFLILNLLFAIWDIKRELKEMNRRAEKESFTIQDWTEIFNQISEGFEQVNNRKMPEAEKIQQWKIKRMELKPDKTYLGLTKEDIKKMLKRLGYW